MSYLSKVSTINPRSKRDSEYLFSNENIKGIVKSEICNLCSKLFNHSSNGHDILAQFAKNSERYNTDASFDPSDRTKVKLEVRKFYEGIRNNLPQIIIADGGCNYKPSGLGSHQGVDIVNNKFLYEIPITREIPILINVLTLSQQDTEQLTQAIQIFWSDILGLINGGRILPDSPDAHWYIHIPKNIDCGTVDKTNMGDDPITQIWSSVTTLTVNYGDVLFITKDSLPTVDLTEIQEKISIDLDTTVKSGRRIEFEIHGLKYGQIVNVTNHKCIDLLDSDVWFRKILIVHSPCVFDIQVLDSTVDINSIIHSGPSNYSIAYSKTITATY